jgi:hypothetical protein
VAIFNRLLIILLALVVLAAASIVLLTAFGLIQPSAVAPAGAWFVDRLVPIAQLDPTLLPWSVGVSLALVVLALLLLFVELRPGSRTPRHLTLKDDDIGQVTMTLDGVRGLMEHEASRVPGVERSRGQVEEMPTGLQISCRVAIDPGSSVLEVTEALRQRLKTSVEHHVGLAVTRISIDAEVTQVATADTRHRPRVE